MRWKAPRDRQPDIQRGGCDGESFSAHILSCCSLVMSSDVLCILFSEDGESFEIKAWTFPWDLRHGGFVIFKLALSLCCIYIKNGFGGLPEKGPSSTKEG